MSEVESIAFDADSHVYTDARGKVPSVTGVLQSAGIVDYSAVPAHVRETAMDRGTKVHLATELYDRGELDEESLDERLRPYFEGYKRFLDDTSFVVEEIERRVFHPTHRYAGTFDRLGRLGKKRALVDIKTGALQAWTGLQLAGYELALEQEDVFVDRRCGLELRKNGTYKLHEFDDDNDRAVWLAIVTLHKWRERND